MAGDWGNGETGWSSVDCGRPIKDLQPKTRKGIFGFLKGLGR